MTHRPGRAALAIAVLLGVLVAMAAPASAGATKSPFRGGAFEPPQPAPDFALASTNGREFRLGEHRGKVVAIGFGYTFCPDVCPTTLADLAQVRARLGGAAARFQVAYVTVDPERDTLDRLRAYMKAFDSTFVGLTGPAERLADVRKAYGVSIERALVKGSATAYLVHHTAAIYLVDPAGRLRVMLPFGTAIPDIVHDVKLLLER
jgi:protein SCO1/2